MADGEIKQRNWTLVKGEVQLRSGESLASLAKVVVQAGGGRMGALLDRLGKLRPLDDRPEHAAQHAYICVRRARRIARDPLLGLKEEDVSTIMSAYETGLIAGLYGMGFPFGDLADEKPGQDELRDVTTIGFRHGDIIKQWWSSYAAMVDAFFGEKVP